MNEASAVELAMAQTNKLARRIQVELMNRQQALLRIPDVLYQVTADLTEALSAEQNRFVNILEAILIEGAWMPINQLSRERINEHVGAHLNQLAFSYKAQVKGRAKGRNLDLSQRQLFGVLDHLQFNDLYLGGFFTFRETLTGRSHSEDGFEVDATCIISDFDSAQARLDDLIEEMMRINEPCFRGIIRPYMTGSFDTADLLAEANTGFYRACVKFKPGDGGSGFYGFLKRWIVARVVAFIDRESSIVSVGLKSGSEFRKIRKARKELDQSGNGVVDINEVARRVKMTVAEVEEYEQSYRPWLGSEDMGDLLHLHSDAATPEEALEEEDNSNLIKHLIGQLDNREAQIIVGRYGIGCEPKTLEELGESFGISGEMVRQIQRKAEAKMGSIAQG